MSLDDDDDETEMAKRDEMRLKSEGAEADGLAGIAGGGDCEDEDEEEAGRAGRDGRGSGRGCISWRERRDGSEDLYMSGWEEHNGRGCEVLVPRGNREMLFIDGYLGNCT